MNASPLPKITVTLFPPFFAAPTTQHRARLTIDPNLSDLIPIETLWQLRVVPITRHGRIITCAMEDPEDLEAQAQVQALTGLRVRPVAASAQEITRLLTVWR